MEWNRTLTVLKDPDGKTGFDSLSVDDILFFRIVNGQMNAHTVSNKYYLVGGEKVKRMLDTFHAVGCHFYSSDRSDYPDLQKIKLFNKTWYRAYFTEKPDENSKFIYISRYRYEEFVKLTKQFNNNFVEIT